MEEPVAEAWLEGASIIIACAYMFPLLITIWDCACIDEGYCEAACMLWLPPPAATPLLPMTV